MRLVLLVASFLALTSAARAAPTIVFEHGTMRLAPAERSPWQLAGAWEENYDRQFPNGDFYYLTGHLDESDEWSESDYTRFFKNARWLSLHGFRVVINPAAYASDLREAAQNPHTSAILWNSHGVEEGGIQDRSQAVIDFGIFHEEPSPRLRYVYFATCFGAQQVRAYGITSPVKGYGEETEITSDSFFEYYNSDRSTEDLERALGHKLEPVAR